MADLQPGEDPDGLLAEQSRALAALRDVAAQVSAGTIDTTVVLRGTQPDPRRREALLFA
jgi:hypothetical protein